MEDVEVLDDVKEKLLQELLDMNEGGGKGERASAGGKAAGWNEGSEYEPPATKKKRLCNLLQRRTLLCHQTRASVQKKKKKKSAGWPSFSRKKQLMHVILWQPYTQVLFLFIA